MNVSDVMVRDVKYVEASELVGKALSMMERLHFKELPVLSGGKIAGLITFHAIMTLPNYDKALKVDKLMFKTPVLRESDNLLTALRLMKESGVQGLPVLRNDSLVGFVSDYDLLKVLKSEFKNVTVSDVMLGSPAALKLTDNLAKAKRVLHYSRTDLLPVIDDNNKLAGILRERDLSVFLQPTEVVHGRTSGEPSGRKGEGDSVKLLNAAVSEFMKSDYFDVHAGESVPKVIDLMLENHVTSVFVTDDAGEPIGFIERAELVDYLYRKLMPRGVFLTFSGLKIDYDTNVILTKVVTDHLNTVNYLAKNISSIMIYIKGVHSGKGVRKFQIDLKVDLNSGVTQHVSKVGYALRECLDETLTDVEKIMKKEYKKRNP